MSRGITYFIVLGFSLGACLGAAQPGAEKTPPEAGPIFKNDAAPLPVGARLRLGKLAGSRCAGQPATATLSADGKLLAVAEFRGTISIVNLDTGQIVQSFKGDFLSGTNSSMTFSADNSTLAIQSLQNLSVWHIATGSRHVIPGRGGFGTRYHGPGLSADGKIVGAATDRPPGKQALTGEVKAIEIASGKIIGPFKCIHNRTIRTAVAPDGTTMLSWGQVLGNKAGNKAADNRDAVSTIQVWDLAKGQELRKIKLSAAVQAAAYAPDGKSIAAATGVDGLQLIDFESGKKVHRFLGVRSIGNVGVRFSPDGRLLAAFDANGGLQAWDVVDNNPVALVKAPKMPMHAVAFPGKDRMIALGMLGPTLCWWDATDATATQFDGHLAPLAALTFSADGRSLISAGNDNRLIWWDATTGQEQRRLALPADDRLPAGVGRPTAIALSPDGTRAATHSYLGPRGVQLFDLKDGKSIRQFPSANVLSVLDLKFSGDGSKLSLAGMDEPPVRVWDANTGQVVYAMPMPQAANLDFDTAAAVSPDGKILAVYQFDPFFGDVPQAINDIMLWDLAAKKERRRIHVPRANPEFNSVPGPSFSADGKYLAVAAGQGILLYSTATGREWHKLVVAARVSTPQFAFSADGRFIAAGTSPRSYALAGGAVEEASIEIWEIASGQKRQQFKGHFAGVTCLAFSPDGATLATGSLDTTVLLWDVAGKNAKAAPFAESEIAAAWNSLVGADANVSLTMRRLIRTPATIGFLKQHFPPAKNVKVDEKKLAVLVADLDSGNFKARELAMRELKRLGERAEAVLKNRLADNPTVEARRRIQSLLEAMIPTPATPQELQAIRGVEILERIATPEARAWLSALAKGDPLARGTQEAAAALKRMK